MEKFKVSERRACSVLELDRSTKRYVGTKVDCPALKRRLCELAFARPRYGFRRLHILLLREGYTINKKRTYRLYRESGLLMRTKRRKKRASHLRTVPPAATRRNERWSMDFVADTLSDGRKFRLFTLIDTFTRECLAIDVGWSMTSPVVSQILDRVIAKRGKPAIITLDNGTEFTSNHFDEWAYRTKVALDFIQPGRPMENGHIESFNGRLRDECLNANWFESLDEARQVVEDWRVDYNEVRPHSSLGQLPPATYAALGVA
jgi:putative transposase